MTFATETDYAVDAQGLTALPPCTDVAAEFEALERELTSLAGQLNAGNYRFLMLLAEFDRRGAGPTVQVQSLEPGWSPSTT